MALLKPNGKRCLKDLNLMGSSFLALQFSTWARTRMMVQRVSVAFAMTVSSVHWKCCYGPKWSPSFQIYFEWTSFQDVLYQGVQGRFGFRWCLHASSEFVSLDHLCLMGTSCWSVRSPRNTGWWQSSWKPRRSISIKAQALWGHRRSLMISFREDAENNALALGTNITGGHK